MSIAFSVDLEPNKDGSFEGVKAAMDWYDSVIPNGTVYTTYRIATERPRIVASLAKDHEIGVHVHPREFNHESDYLATLERNRQRELIERTRAALLKSADLTASDVTAFRAGRHSADETTIEVLSELGFDVDASFHIRYDTVGKSLSNRRYPFSLNGITEIPTTWVRPQLLSRLGLRVFPNRNVTATSTTVREDHALCSGTRAMATILETAPFVSFYMHPYDATSYHEDLRNNGHTFRTRVEDLFGTRRPAEFVAASDISPAQATP